MSRVSLEMLSRSCWRWCCWAAIAARAAAGRVPRRELVAGGHLHLVGAGDRVLEVLALLDEAGRRRSRPSPVSTAKRSRSRSVSLLASDGLSRRRRREYACAAMGDEATGTADGSPRRRRGSTGPGSRPGSPRNVPGVQPPLSFERISGGHSNLTYGVRDAAGRSLGAAPPAAGQAPRLRARHGARAQGRLGAGRRPPCRWRRWSGSARTRASTARPST